MANPCVAGFLRCELTPSDTWDRGPEYQYNEWKYEFGTASFEGGGDVRIQSVAFRGDIVVPFGVQLDAHVHCGNLGVQEDTVADGSARKSQRVRQLTHAIRAHLPWLQEQEIERYLVEKHTELEPAVSEDDNDGDDDDVIDRISAEDAAADLLAASARVALDVEGDGVDLVNFYIKVLGGKWTHEHHGVGVYRVGCFRRAHTQDFITTFGLQMSYTFALPRYDSEKNCRMLAQRWLEKLTFFYLVWRSHDSPIREFTKEEIDEFVESQRWLDWACDVDMEFVTFSEISELRNFVPQLA